MSKTPTSLTTPFAVRIERDDKAWMESERERTGESVNAMITRAVRQYVRQRKGVRNRGGK